MSQKIIITITSESQLAAKNFLHALLCASHTEAEQMMHIIRWSRVWKKETMLLFPWPGYIFHYRT